MAEDVGWRRVACSCAAARWSTPPARVVPTCWSSTGWSKRSVPRSQPGRATVLDAEGALVSPGLVDLHTHLRQPGREEAETVESGARAAALGGYTAVVAMPNTEPAIDSAAVARQVLDLGRGAPCEVAVAGAITAGRR